MAIIIHNIEEFDNLFRQPSLHPFVMVGDLSEASEAFFEQMETGAFGIFFMKAYGGALKKNRKSIRYGSDSIITFRPGDLVYLRKEEEVKPSGLVLAFRPEFIVNTGLGRDFYMFNFFDYEVYEPLSLNSDESVMIQRCFADLRAELATPADELTAHMVRLCIGRLLSCCKRYYSRQFETAQLGHSEIVRKLNSILDDYLATGSELPRKMGPPTVAWCARELHLAPNYFGSLVKKELHFSAQEFIHNRVLDKAKSLLAGSDKSVSEVSETLGFSYPNHFARFFSQRVGMTPSAFRRKSRGI
ncbi:MAG: helix-turn-helix transcriptional regulator [Bacteroidales bacterium]|nr:helix-turn-helix transcriptional regulator [Bacteroidales bacterium]